jgi:hypothetical protein
MYTQYHVHDVKIQIPVGYKPALGVQPRCPREGEHYLSRGKAIQAGTSYRVDEFIILIKDQPPIDTSTIEYKLEVVRQYMLGKQVQVYDEKSCRWLDTPSFTTSLLLSIKGKIRVRPEGVVIDGEHSGKGMYRDENGKYVVVPE